MSNSAAASKATDLVTTKEQDYLDQDAEIRGQKYVCLSFISPEDVIKQKDVYFFNQFIKHFSADLNTLFSNMKERFKDDAIVVDMITNLHERYDYVFKDEALQKEYDFFKESNVTRLESEYLEKNNFQTSVRGIKVRGTYETIAEAKNRCQAIKRFDKNFDVYVAEVGCWCPWSPFAEEIKDQEYAETMLNTLMKKYRENLEDKDEYYRLRMEEMVSKVKKHSDDQKDANNQTVEVEKVLVENKELNAAFVTLPDSVNESFEQKDPWLSRKDAA